MSDIQSLVSNLLLKEGAVATALRLHPFSDTARSILLRPYTVAVANLKLSPSWHTAALQTIFEPVSLPSADFTNINNSGYLGTVIF